MLSGMPGVVGPAVRPAARGSGRIQLPWAAPAFCRAWYTDPARVPRSSLAGAAALLTASAMMMPERGKYR